MSTMPLTCAEVIRALADALRQNSGEVEPMLAEHVVGCPRCRAGLLLAVHGWQQAASEPLPEHLDSVCARCQDDLAAFIDLEQRDPRRAASRYPQVWWHLWTCASCAQVYELTRRLLQAEQEGRLPSLEQLLKTQRPAAPQLRIPLLRRALRVSVPQRPMVARSSPRAQGGQQYVLYHSSLRSPQPGSAMVEVEEREHQRWRLTIRVAPPIEALAVVTCEPFRSIALFDASGVATVDDLPQQVLSDPNLPDLDIQVFLLDDKEQ